MESQIAEWIQKRIDAGFYIGASFVFGTAGKKICEVHQGRLSRELVQPITSETLFDLQSITKAVATAPLCLKLIQDGKIQLEDPISWYLPEATQLQDVTIQHLLTHTSGLSDSSLAGEFKKPDALWKQMLSAQPIFQPGTAIEYTDLGYRLLGKALENVAGMNLQEACQKWIWSPLALRTMTYNPVDKMKTAATPDIHGIIDDEQVFLLGGILGCDGVFSNAEDLFNLMSNFLSAAPLLKPSILDLLDSTVTSFGAAPQSFFEALSVGSKNAGWEVNDSKFSYAGRLRSKRTYEKAGGAGTFIWWDRDSKHVFVYLTNYGKPKPFDEANWNRLLSDVGPDQLSNRIAEFL